MRIALTKLAHVPLLASMLAVASCAVVPTTDTSGVGIGDGGMPTVLFADSACYRCFVIPCSGQINTCNLDTSCAGWFNCLKACPVQPNGVTVSQVCASRCTEPSNNVLSSPLATCIQDYSTGRKTGCEAPCTPFAETPPAATF